MHVTRSRWLGRGIVLVVLVAWCAMLAQPAPRAAAALTTVRINVGGGAYTDHSGNHWEADSGYVGGHTYTTTYAIDGTNDPALYQSGRYNMSGYNVTLPNGSYAVTLYEAETHDTHRGERVFSVKAEGVIVESNVDLYARFGADRAGSLTFTTAVTNGKLQLAFTATADGAKVDALLINETAPAAKPTAAPTATPKPTTKPTPAPTATAKPTAAPTATPKPTAAPTAAPTATCGAVSATDVPECGAWWGAYVNGDGVANVQNLGTTEGRSFDIIHQYHTMTYAFPTTDETAAAHAGQTLFIAWTTDIGGTTVPAGYPTPDIKLAKDEGYSAAMITAGKLNSQIDAEAVRVKALGLPIMLSINHEPDVVAASAFSGHWGTAAQEKAAWRYMFLRMRADGATNIIPVWVVIGDQNAAFYQARYPGDDVIDWIGWDPYNTNASQPLTAEQTVARFYTLIEGPKGDGTGGALGATTAAKPLMIAEYGSSVGTAAQRAAWYAGVPAALRALPRIRAAVIFDAWTQYSLPVGAPEELAFRGDGHDAYVNQKRRTV